MQVSSFDHDSAALPTRINTNPKSIFRRRNRNPRHFTVLMSLGFVVSLLLTMASPVSATVSHRSSGQAAKAKPDFSYFAGKTISFISPGAPGGSYDDLARILAPVIASYLHCTVNVTDISTGGGITGQNYVAAAAPNGLTIGELNSAGDIENFVDGSSGLTFSFKQQEYIAGVPEVNIVWMVNPSSSYSSITQIIKPSGPIKVLDVTSGYQDLLDRVLLGAYGVPTSDLITGFSGSPALLAGFLDDDGPIANIGLQAVEPTIAAGLARPLMLTLPMTPGALGYAILHKLKLPTYATILKKHPPKTAAGREALKELVNISTGAGQVVFAPNGTPKKLVLALTAAVRSALNQKAVKAEEDNEGLQTGYITPTAVATNFGKMLRKSTYLAPYLPTP
jgi:hypothetical protein